jgi:hypothetical protein
LILEAAIFPSVAWFLKAAGKPEVKVAMGSMFQKQSDHSRYFIGGPNKTQCLSVPVKHTGHKKSLLKTEVSYLEKWPREHMNAMRSAYGKAPFFEFYDYRIFPVYEEMPLLLETLIRQSILKLSKELLPETNILFENLISEAQTHPEVPGYSQVFEDRFGFRNDLSALDLLFNLGPDAAFYLEDNATR